MKIASIGLGDIAQKAYLPLMVNWPGLEWVLCSRDDAKLATLATQYRVSETASDIQQCLALGVDGVMIHSATDSHAALIRTCLQAGVPVFVDKPVAPSGAEVEALFNLAEQQQTPLFAGFNRRYLPLLNTHLNGQRPEDELGTPLLSLRWEKHRHALPDAPRRFIFDDFIHPLDSINVHGDINIDDLDVFAQFSEGLLGRLDVRWHRDNSLFEASMNRQYGVTKETIAAAYRNECYFFDGFTRGARMQDNVTTQLTLPDWTGMQASKGFAAMLSHWFEVVSEGRVDAALTARNVASHWAAEDLVAYCEALRDSP
ncbi:MULTISPECIES: Gfo/Idh/MocA family protein [Salinivibrio]|uniref:Oxidoreductase n=1 Tax=Salinivibrio siamensis TaxID=414286 RepID=A0ABX3KBA8_9GAMM|nr:MULTISPECIES: Gfo/Idh/MocA family oxidoreductase [Salinivibrio]KKA45821.1 oxidoreductase [Salinivibrio sp. KP-1]OOE69558.1 oxidoreductase [Salinivibrio sp. IB868]OOE71936.1 oxidoreductase [Salinivibrio sp. IB870]OOE81963.1 oxidoreductase [Salinivibrio sp. ML198]OOE86185.1 oxidoreductase [Salinivibrio siamensis]